MRLLGAFGRLLHPTALSEEARMSYAALLKKNAKRLFQAVEPEELLCAAREAGRAELIAFLLELRKRACP